MTPRTYHFFSVLLLIILTVGSCAVSPVTGKRELMLMTEEGELRWGDNVYPDALWGDVGGGGAFKDRELEAYLGDIVKRLHSMSHRPRLPLTFVIQNSSIPNAWALPGHIAMTRGLLAELETEAQFAFIMGHELGHVSARHSAKQYTQRTLQGGLLMGGAALLKDGRQADALLRLGAVGSTLLLLKYSRSQELEADRLGVQYMAKAGYVPDQAVGAHRRLEAAVDKYLARMGMESSGSGFLTDLLSTHPRSEMRIGEVRATAREVAGAKKEGDGINKERFLRMTKQLREADKAYHQYDLALAAFEKERLPEALEHLKIAMKMDPKHAPFHHLSGLIYMKSNDSGRAESAFREALRIDPDYQPSHQALGVIRYNDGRYEDAITDLTESLRIYPGNLVSHYVMGLSHFRLGNYGSAISHLESFGDAVPQNGEVHGLLGISYESLGRPDKAYGEYVLQLRVAPDSDLGAYAERRVRELRGDSR